ncbi:hypothetical protein PF008_g24795 [Phytophthora fragariae]|uniref:PiggyBac transposable element-derived protein domain-containing protein n=2 Tax=Phytophthora TaxID=4783 RepID=A0A6G0QM02_9STRA|nr:hypothetical protein PF008_g24795 [Phytophthora fragariae]
MPVDYMGFSFRPDGFSDRNPTLDVPKDPNGPNGHRLLVCDNFYTRRNRARTLLRFTDGEMRTLGTVRIILHGKYGALATG